MANKNLFKNIFSPKEENINDPLLNTENEEIVNDENNNQINKKINNNDESVDVDWKIDNNKKAGNNEIDKVPPAEDFWFEEICKVRMLNGTTVMFQGTVTETAVNKAIALIKQAFINVNTIGLTYPELKGQMSVKLVLDTPGGSIIQGFRLCDSIKYYNNNTDIKIVGYVEGMCASMGVPILLSCNEKYMTPNSTMMIHQLSAGAMGKYSEIQDYMKFYNDLQNKLSVYIAENSKIKKEKVDELMKRESFLTTQEALDYGLIDGVKEIYY